MDTSLLIATILAKITVFALPGSLLFLIVGTILDIFKKKFYWSKFALIFFVITIILLVIEIKLIYSVTQDISNYP